jgi:hypothetical protein
MRFLSYRSKVCDYLLPELLVYFIRWIMLLAWRLWISVSTFLSKYLEGFSWNLVRMSCDLTLMYVRTYCLSFSYGHGGGLNLTVVPVNALFRIPVRSFEEYGTNFTFICTAINSVANRKSILIYCSWWTCKCNVTLDYKYEYKVWMNKFCHNHFHGTVTSPLCNPVSGNFELWETFLRKLIEWVKKL